MPLAPEVLELTVIYSFHDIFALLLDNDKTIFTDMCLDIQFDNIQIKFKFYADVVFISDGLIFSIYLKYNANNDIYQSDFLKVFFYVQK